jgi:hypothetical protein
VTLLLHQFLDRFDGFLPTCLGRVCELVQGTAGGDTLVAQPFLQDGDLALEVVDDRVMGGRQMFAHCFGVDPRLLWFLGVLRARIEIGYGNAEALERGSWSRSITSLRKRSSSGLNASGPCQNGT